MPVKRISVKSRKIRGSGPFSIRHKKKTNGTKKTYTSHGSVPPRITKGGKKSRKTGKSRKARK